MATNYPACHAFPLTPEWVTNSWATQKIASSTAKAEYVRAKKHIRNYLENVDYHAQCEADRAIAERKKAAEAALLPLQKQATQVFGSHWAIVCGQNNFCLFPGGRLQDSRGGLWLG